MRPSGRHCTARPDLHADAAQPATGHLALFVLSFLFLRVREFPGNSLHFLSLHFRFSSLHLLERPFIRMTSTSPPTSRQFPAHRFISLQLLFVSQNFQHYLFVSVLRFPSRSALAFSCDLVSLSPIFSPLVRIASMHSIIRIIWDDAGNAGGVVQY